MTLTINLSGEEERKLVLEAGRAGVPPAELARRLVAAGLPDVDAGQNEDPTLHLFGQWAEEDERKTADELGAEERLWAEFEREVNEARRAQGMRTL